LARFLLRSIVVCSVALILTTTGRAQSCEVYLDSALRQSSDLKFPAEFRVHAGAAVNDHLQGLELLGAGGIASGTKPGTLEGTADFRWVERRLDTAEGESRFRLVRSEKVRVVMFREGQRVFVSIQGGQRPLLLEPQCTDGLVYVEDKTGGSNMDWVFQLPFLTDPTCCSNAVLTQHNDIGRTGAYLSENTLTPPKVTIGSFGFLFPLDVDGAVFAQPLYVPNVKMPDGTHHNVLYVATATDNVYAFDADNRLKTAPLWHQSLGLPAGANEFKGYRTAYPNVGVTSTPVIDLDKGIMYLVAKIVTYSKGQRIVGDQIFAVDITSGKVLDSASVTASWGCPTRPSKKGDPACTLTAPINFDASLQHNRSGLLLLKGRVYFAYGQLANEGSNLGPNGDYHGWIFSFDAANLQSPPVTFNTSPYYSYVGIWQSGNGLASDGTYIYANTGNGSREYIENKDLQHNDFKKGQYGDSILKLSADLNVVQKYTPPNVLCLDTCDLDVASAGPVLFPGSDVLLSGAKEGIFYVLARKDIRNLSQCAFRAADQPGFGSQVPYCSTGTDNNGCELPDPNKFCGDKPATDWLTIAHTYSNIHGSPVVLQTRPGEYQTYVWPEENTLRMFKYSGGRLLHTPTLAQGSDAQAPPSSMPGGILSLSANGQSKNAILWATIAQDCTDVANNCSYANMSAEGAIDASVPGRFVAFDASTLKELWVDWSVGYFAKFNPPTIANGKVYVANFGAIADGSCAGNYNQGLPSKSCGQVRVYGLLPSLIHIPFELSRWPPDIFVDPGPLAPGILRRGD
jgi:hypothetical protein